MISRALHNLVLQRLRAMPGVVLFGPRQVGKTTLAQAIVAEWGGDAVYLDLERESDRRRLDDADAYLRGQSGRLTVLDEVHRLPGLFPTLRGIIDARRATGDFTGQFLLLGSASLELQRQAGESLAGRVSYLELAQVLASEYVRPEHPGASVDQLWLRGGFPDSLLAPDDEHSFAWREDFVRSYLERDIPMFAPRTSPTAIKRLWRMLAHAQGTPLNKARLAGNLEVSAPTITSYIDSLADLLLVRLLPPWSGNLSKRLVRTPKIYLRDSGIVHALLGIVTLDELLGHPVVGASWEGFVIEQLIAAAGPQRQAMYFRTATGAEADLVFEHGGRVEMVIEIKRSSAPTVSSGLRVACEDLQPTHAFAVHGGAGQGPMGRGVTAISLLEMIQLLSMNASLRDNNRWQNKS